MRIDYIDSDGLWTERRGILLPLRELSDGYRTVAALVLDILKQLETTFGTLGLEWNGSSPIVGHAGVVLIDEADIHLHVSWQQRIGFWLKEHFPKIQFLVTTHSPFIMGSGGGGREESGRLRGATGGPRGSWGSRRSGN